LHLGGLVRRRKLGGAQSLPTLLSRDRVDSSLDPIHHARRDQRQPRRAYCDFTRRFDDKFDSHGNSRSSCSSAEILFSFHSARNWISSPFLPQSSPHYQRFLRDSTRRSHMCRDTRFYIVKLSPTRLRRLRKTVARDYKFKFSSISRVLGDVVATRAHLLVDFPRNFLVFVETLIAAVDLHELHRVVSRETFHLVSGSQPSREAERLKFRNAFASAPTSPLCCFEQKRQTGSQRSFAIPSFA
jgi:hypothetical protein